MWRLAAAGTRVRVFTPTAEDVAAMGSDWMDARRHRRVFETAMRTTAPQLAAGEPPATRSGDVGGVA